MKKHGRKLAFGILAAVFLAGLVLMLLQLRQYDDARQSNDRAEALAFGEAPTQTQPQVQQTQPTTPTEPEEQLQQTLPEVPEIPMDEAARYLQQVDIFSLRQVNPEVLGWIYLPDTVISYPLMETRERDKYLTHAWDGSYNGGGSIFLEKSNRRDFTDFNTIIYGHHLNNGTMFQPLMNYREADFAAGHPYVYITTDSAIYRYRVFAAYEAPIESDTYRLYFPDDEARQTAIDWYLQGREDMVLTPRDRVLTLSTCTGTGVYTTRWVVQAVLDAQWQK